MQYTDISHKRRIPHGKNYQFRLVSIQCSQRSKRSPRPAEKKRKKAQMADRVLCRESGRHLFGHRDIRRKGPSARKAIHLHLVPPPDRLTSPILPGAFPLCLPEDGSEQQSLGKGPAVVCPDIGTASDSLQQAPIDRVCDSARSTRSPAATRARLMAPQCRHRQCITRRPEDGGPQQTLHGIPSQSEALDV